MKSSIAEGNYMSHKLPSKDYVAMLDIKLIVKKWQDLETSDTDALIAINQVIKKRM